MELEGRTAVVTGGASGIGRSTSLKFAEEGANVVVADLSPEPALEGRPTHQKIQDEGGDATFIKTDVSDEESIEGLVEAAVDEYGLVDILVNSAGVHHSGRVTDEKADDWDQLMKVNLRGTFLCSKHVLEHMLEKGVEGDVINVGSIAGLVGYAGNAAYCASKGGIVELTREMAIDYSAEGININAVNPGVIKTDMTVEMLEDDEKRRFMEKNTATPRLGEPEDVANAVSFLASEDSNFITGENLVVDGGWTAR